MVVYYTTQWYTILHNSILYYTILYFIIAVLVPAGTLFLDTCAVACMARAIDLSTSSAATFAARDKHNAAPLVARALKLIIDVSTNRAATLAALLDLEVTSLGASAGECSRNARPCKLGTLWCQPW